MRKASNTAADTIATAMNANPYAHLMFTNIAQRILGGVHPLKATRDEVVALSAYFQTVAIKGVPATPPGEMQAPVRRGPGRPPKNVDLREVADTAVESPKRKRRGSGRPRKNAVAATAKRGPGRPRKVGKRGPGRPRKVLAAGEVRRGPGRPRKVLAAGEVRRGPGRPRKVVAAGDATTSTTPKRGRGRPPKAGLPVVPDAGENAPSPTEVEQTQPVAVGAGAPPTGEAEILDLTFGGAPLPPVL